MNEVEFSWLVRPESQVVEERYRLRAADLRRRKCRAHITNVTYQGVEQVHFVLHFAELAKPLSLNRTQCEDVIRSTGSGNVSDWIGQTVMLAPETHNGHAGIRIGPAPETVLPRNQLGAGSVALAAVAPSAEHTGRGSARTTLLLALLLALLLSLVYLLEQSEQMWSLFGM